MDINNIILIGLNLLLLFFLIFAGRKASAARLLQQLKIYCIILLCWLPVFIALYVVSGLGIKESFHSPVSTISTITVICLIFSTLIQYLIKRKKESQEEKNHTEVKVEISQHKKRLRIVMIPACVLPILVFAGLLFDKSIRSDTTLLTIIISIICVLLFMLVLFLKKLK